MRLVANGPGIGDGLVLTAVARAARQQCPDVDLEVIVPHPELWAHNPDVTRVGLWTPAQWGERSFAGFDDMRSVQGHVIQAMCRQLDLPVPATRAVRPYFYPSDAERYPVSGLPARYLTVNAESAKWSENRDWPLERWARTLRALHAKGWYTVQIGARTDAVLACHADWRGRPLREVARVLAHSQAHLCPVSGTMVLSAAVGGRAVVVWTGREDPVTVGYPRHRLVSYRPPMGCAPCWKREPCPHGRRIEFTLRKPCLDGIEVEEIVAAVETVTQEDHTPWDTAS